MFAHVIDRAPLYLVMLSAALLAVLAFVGLCTESPAVSQILVVSIVLLLAIELSLACGCRSRR